MPANMNATTVSESRVLPAPVERVPLSRYLVFSSVALVGLIVDLGTKAWCFSQPALRAGDIYWLWQGHVGIQLSMNRGALFGIGQGKIWIFALLSLAAAIAIPVWLFAFRAARDGWLTFALGCIMAGVLGNLYDRLGLHGESMRAVRDWILWQVNDEWRWPNFNIADSMLVIGACLLFLHALRQPKAEQSSNADAA